MSEQVRSRCFGSLQRASGAFCLALAVALAPIRAQADAPSEASALSAVPVAVSVVAPSMVLSAGVMLTVVAVETLAEGTVWVLQRASDGARVVIKVLGKATGAASVAAGTVVTVSAVGAGVVLSAAGQVLAFVPNTLGKALLHHERVID